MNSISAGVSEKFKETLKSVFMLPWPRQALLSTPDFALVKTRLLSHLEVLVGDRDPYLASGKHHLVQQYIQSVFAPLGPVTCHTFTVRARHHHTWMLSLPAAATASPAAAPIIVGAHYDTVPGTPGADDNASGLAVLLELARYYATQALPRPVWLAAFDMEEYGLLGSRAYAESLRASGQAVHLMLSLEMLGYCDRTPHSQDYPSPLLAKVYPHTGDYVALVGNPSTILAMRRLRRHLRRTGTACEYLPVPNRGTAIAATRRSDHAAFWDCGYRALMVTDTAFLRNPHYHQPSDRLETLDLNFMTHICLGLMTGLTTIA